MTSAQSWLEPTSSLPIFKGLFLVIYKNQDLLFRYSWKNVKNYYSAKFQADPGMFSYQNRWGLNRPILHPLWLAEADVISVLSVKQLYEWFSPSVRLSVCLSVTPFWLCSHPASYHHEIFRSYYQQVLELMQMHPKERLGRVILTASWFNIGYRFHTSTVCHSCCNNVMYISVENLDISGSAWKKCHADMAFLLARIVLKL